MTKEQFIKLVSKVEQTQEDEFKAEYNSPELIWERVVKPAIAQIKIETATEITKQLVEIANILKSGQNFNPDGAINN